MENWEIVFLRTPPGHKRWCLDRKGGSKLIAKRKNPINSLGDKQINNWGGDGGEGGDGTEGEEEGKG